MKAWVRTLWRFQPLPLRRLEMRVLTKVLAHKLDCHRQLLPGDAVVGGFLGTATGLGEGARHMLRQFQAAGITAYGANVSRFAVMEDFDAGALWPAPASVGGIVIFHINPDILNLVLAAVGQRRLRQRRTVGYWAWELNVVPPNWIDALKCVDEVWVPSRFIANALQRTAPGTVVNVLPLPVDTATARTVPRQDPLPQFAGRPVVLFAFDVRSTIARKNPEAVIEAFRRATLNDPNPVLVLKVNNESAWAGARAQLENAVAGLPNIHIIREVMSQDGMKDLIARADIVMSLHRAEGFGLLLAEAMAAAKPVIATGWSGNLDFMPPDCCVLVDYKLVPVCDRQHTYDGFATTWAEPDIGQAAAALRRLLDDPAERKRLGAAAQAQAAKFFSAASWMASLPESFWAALKQSEAK